MDALSVEPAILAGYDWGGRAACIVAALWPERVRGLVSVNGYNIQDIQGSAQPQDPAQERRYWYQWYFHTERGRAALELDRRGFCRLLWQLWSPNWAFDEATFTRSAVSFDNPDFVDVTIHSYRHRYGNAAGDPALEEIEKRLAAKPKIAVPTIALQGEADGVLPPEMSKGHSAFFSGPYQYRVPQKSVTTRRKKRPPFSPMPYWNWPDPERPIPPRPVRFPGKYSKRLLTTPTFAETPPTGLHRPLHLHRLD